MVMPSFADQAKLFHLIPSVESKRCPRCGHAKLLDQFSNRTKGMVDPCSYCRECQREYCQHHYTKHSKLHNARRYQRQKLTRNELARKIQDYKKNKACVDCGERDPVVLEFDHVRGVKRAEICMMIRLGRDWQLISEEISKCDLRCANCHRRKTAKQFGWKI